jgi:hypothetical protein
MTISQKQLEANRANALKSTGPRTPEGKAIVALNPIRHGLLSKEVLLATEDESALVDMGKRMRHDLAPAGELEMILVDRIISAAWRLRRVLKIENDLIDTKISSELANYRRKKGGEIQVNLWEAMNGYKTLDNVAMLNRYEAHIERGMYKAIAELHRLQAARFNKVFDVVEVMAAVE